jgi:hypothetical protein
MACQDLNLISSECKPEPTDVAGKHFSSVFRVNAYVKGYTRMKQVLSSETSFAFNGIHGDISQKM